MVCSDTILWPCQVRIWTRMGHSPATIQQELDHRFADVLQFQEQGGGEKQKPAPSPPVAASIASDQDTHDDVALSTSADKRT